MIDHIREDRISTIMMSGKTRAEAERIVDAPIPLWSYVLTLCVGVAVAAFIVGTVISVFKG